MLLWLFFLSKLLKEEKVMSTMQTVFTEGVSTIMLALLGLLAAYATYGIRKFTAKVKMQTEQLKDEGARLLLNNALEDVEELTAVTVAAIEQTTAKSLREAVKAGKADREELLALASRAAIEISAAVKPEAARLIEENFGSFRDYVAKLIEEKVLSLKTIT
jgi:Na+-transporting methylmalonyl-CoA/oxaloacetate decarboxylase gamma subunit